MREMSSPRMHFRRKSRSVFGEPSIDNDVARGSGASPGGQRDVHSEPDDDNRLGGRNLGENSREFAVADQNIVGPLEKCLDAGRLPNGVDERHAGEQRKPTPVRRWDVGRIDAD